MDLYDMIGQLADIVGRHAGTECLQAGLSPVVSAEFADGSVVVAVCQPRSARFYVGRNELDLVATLSLMGDRVAVEVLDRSVRVRVAAHRSVTAIAGEFAQLVAGQIESA